MLQCVYIFWGHLVCIFACGKGISIVVMGNSETHTTSYSIVLEVYKSDKYMSETMAYHESTIDAIKYFILPLCL